MAKKRKKAVKRTSTRRSDATESCARLRSSAEEPRKMPSESQAERRCRTASGPSRPSRLARRYPGAVSAVLALAEVADASWQ